MDPIKVSVDVNLHLSEKTEQFILGLFSGKKPTVASQAPAAEKPTVASQAPAAEKPTVASQAPAAVEKPTAASQAPAAKKPVAEKPAANSDVTIDDVRNALKAKVATHRAEIKEKLTELGAPSVTKLERDKYQEMLDFLNSLD